MDIQQRRPQRGGDQPFDQRFLLFMVAALGVLMLEWYIYNRKVYV